MGHKLWQGISQFLMASHHMAWYYLGWDGMLKRDGTKEVKEGNKQFSSPMVKLQRRALDSTSKQNGEEKNIKIKRKTRVNHPNHFQLYFASIQKRKWSS